MTEISKIRFYLDENIANAVASGLRHRAIDVLTTPEAGHIGWTDPQQPAFAVAEKRVMVTQDDDMLVLASSGIEHTGIVYYKPQTRSLKEIIRGLTLVYDVLSPEDMLNHIEFL